MILFQWQMVEFKLVSNVNRETGQLKPHVDVSIFKRADDQMTLYRLPKFRTIKSIRKPHDSFLCSMTILA